MKKLLILGAGQYGFVAREVAEAMGEYSTIQFLDDHSSAAAGKLKDIETVEYDAAFVAIGNPEVRTKWLQKLKRIATLIHPQAHVSPSAVIAEGAIIEAGAVIATGAVIGRGTIVMANAVVGHNALVGDCCQLKYNCTIAENCIVPDGVKVGCNELYGA